MEYFKIFDMTREPFSNSPEPEFCYQSPQHLGCLQQLELAIRLRRGLNVVMGNVGTGKTTLCRELILRFMETEDDRCEIETHLLLDPSFSTTREFLSMVALTFGIAVGEGESDWQIRENIKSRLFHKGVDEKRTVVLIIDEGQKLPSFCLEILREFLNYETNENKLLQIVIFAQKEFREILKDHMNFADRVNQYYLLEPLSFRETQAMIRFRLTRAGRSAGAPLFTISGLWAIYRATGGYPRRIITLCHQILLTLIIQNKPRAGWLLVRSLSRRRTPGLNRRERWSTAWPVALLLLVFFAYLFSMPPWSSVIPYPLNPPATPARSDEAAPGQMKGHPPTTEQLVLAKQVAPLHPAQPVLSVKGGPDLKVPDNLGRLRIPTGGSVIQILRDIYGKDGTDRFQSIIAANPHIEDINRVRTGESITLPAVPATAAPWPQDGKLVRIANKGSLDEAYSFYKKHPLPKHNPVSIRIMPYWNPREGMVYALVIRTFFYNEEEARNAIRSLPPALAATAKIMEKPGADTVYFAN